MKIFGSLLTVALMMAITPLMAQNEFQVMGATEMPEADQASSIALVQSMFDAISAEDLESLDDLFHDEYLVFFPWAEEPRDKASSLENWASNFEYWESVTVRGGMTTLVMDDGEESHNIVMVMFEPTMVTADQPDEEISTMFRADYEIKDGKIYRGWVFYDRMHLQSQMEEE